jgi:RNA polymerase sigma factor (sigma-70 family)
MQEFTWPGRTAETELALDLEKASLGREFEQRLEECGTLAFRVARGVLRNAADAEDVAQEAMLRSYRRFARLRDRSRFRAWLVRISFRLALDYGRSTRRREQRETAWATDLPKPTADDIAASKRIRAAPTESDGGTARQITARFITHKHRWSLARRSGGPPTVACRHREIASAFRTEATCGEITMTCDKYENALLLAAASNDKMDVKLARHLEHCSTCRMTLRSERELFSRIDSTLRAQVNEDPPSAFLAQLRLQLSKEVTPRTGSNRVWHVAGAACALIFIAAFYPLVNARQSSVRRNLETPTIRVVQSAGVTQSARASKDLAVRSRHHSKRPAVQSVVRQEPEILVPQMSSRPLRNSWLASPGATLGRKPL